MFWLERSGHRRDHLLLVLACFALVSFPEKGSECCHCNNSQRACREHPPLTVQPRTVICHLKAHYPWLTLSSCLHMLNQATPTKSLLSLLGSPRGGCFSSGQPPSHPSWAVQLGAGCSARASASLGRGRGARTNPATRSDLL